MNKKEIIADIQGKDFCNRLVDGCNKIGSSSEIPIYRQSYLEVSGDVAMVKSVDFYVCDEGTENEIAYYLVTMMPEATVEAQVSSKTLINKTV